jgi:3-hydroxyacyl-[acyl-carrier-protein] dehydratase
MRVIGVKYCGGCNPHIDRSGLVREIEKLLQPDCRLTTDAPSSRWETAIFVCGCPIACVDRPAVRNMSRHWIRVAGETIDLESVPEDRMAAVVARKIRALNQAEPTKVRD